MGVVVEARLGNSFEDLAAGAAVAEVSETPKAEPVEIETAERTRRKSRMQCRRTAMPVRCRRKRSTARGEVVPVRRLRQWVCRRWPYLLPVEAAPPADAIATLAPVDTGRTAKGGTSHASQTRRRIFGCHCKRRVQAPPSPPVVEAETPKLTTEALGSPKHWRQARMTTLSNSRHVRHAVRIVQDGKRAKRHHHPRPRAIAIETRSQDRPAGLQPPAPQSNPATPGARLPAAMRRSAITPAR